jgi:hypothetical protein
MAMLTLFDLVTLQRNDILTGLVEDVTTYAPEFSRIPVVTRPGTFYEIVRRTALGTAAFRIINNGTTPVKSQYKKEVKEMFFVDVPINVDEAILKGDDKSTGDVWTHESQGALQAALILLGAQTFYGTANDANGFAGVRSQLAGAISATATNISGAPATSTSAYLLWLNGPWGCHFDVGENGQIALPPPMRQQISASAPGATGTLFAWVSNLSCWVGFNVISANSTNGGGATWAVAGITTHISGGAYDMALTDKIAAQLVSNIPLVRRQGLCWFMNRTSHFLLQQSRSAINQQVAGATGQPAWSPPPNLLEGYPIVVTDSITNTEINYV